MSAALTHRRPLEVLPWLVLWGALAISVAAVPVISATLDAYDYKHAWVSAHFATIARSFLEHGILGLGGVPIQNSGPLTVLPDAYLNWPPLYPIVLSGVFAVVGESVMAHHMLAATTNLAIAGLCFALVYRQGDLVAAIAAAVAFLGAPIVIDYAHLGLHLHLAILLCLASLWAFGRATSDGSSPRERARIAAAGLLLFCLSILTSWEPFLAIAGLLFVALLRRDRKAFRLAVLYGAVGAATVGLVFLLYALQYPYFLETIVERILLRAGLSESYSSTSFAFSSPHQIHSLQEPTPSLSLFSYLKGILFARLFLLAPLGLFGLVICATFVRRIWREHNRDAAYVCGGLAASYLIWAVAMSNHLIIHDYQTLIIAPLAAVCAGQVVGAIRRSATLRYAGLYLFTFALAVGLTVPPLTRDRVPSSAWTDDEAQIRFARELRAHTEDNAIVVHASLSMVPVYYAARHIIRGVTDETVLAAYRTRIEDLCQGCPVYLAVPAVAEADFPSWRTRPSRWQRDGLGRLYALRAASSTP